MVPNAHRGFFLPFDQWANQGDTGVFWGATTKHGGRHGPGPTVGTTGPVAPVVRGAGVCCSDFSATARYSQASRTARRAISSSRARCVH